MKRNIIKDAIPYYLACLGLHFIALLCLVNAAIHYPKLWGLGLVAYSLGLRHAFDADHIAAIDNTVRKLVHAKHRSTGVGFFFSLGHSTVVFLMAVIIGFSVKWAKIQMPFFQAVGGKIGACVSGTFLLAVAAFNFIILLSLLKSVKAMKAGQVQQDVLEDLLLSRGFIASLVKPLFKVISKEWQMYPTGFLFGLGFDTATEIALIALSAGAAKASLPLSGILSLPLLFAAGMCLMDTTDSVMMSGAYNWAFEAPLRKIYYNVTVTTISIVAAFFIGALELIQVALESNPTSGFWAWIQTLDLGNLGLWLSFLFAVLWVVTSLIYNHNKKKFSV